MTQPACGPTNCGGCCDATGVCQIGVTAQACGVAGAACTVCAGSLSCTAGICSVSSAGGGGGATGGGGGTTGGGGGATGGGGGATGGGGGATGGGGGTTGDAGTGGGDGGMPDAGAPDAGLAPLLFPQTNLTSEETGSSDPANFRVFGSLLCFSARDATHGRELWCSDGTRAGTRMVADLQLGSGSSNPTELQAIGSTLYFSASTTTAGRELWATDGTAAGTRMLTDLAGVASTSPTHLAELDGYLVFNGANGLCLSDGTPTGTGTVTGFGAADPQNFIKVGAGLYFAGVDYSGRTLMRTDGFPMGTYSPSPLSLDIADNAPRMAAIGSTVYFAGVDTMGAELWKSQGTFSTTDRVLDLRVGSGASSPHELTVIGTTLYFVANDGTRGDELWKSDGTATGTVLVKDIATTSGVGSSPHSLTVVGSTLYFVADDGVNGDEVWKSDGTLAGTVLVKDITPQNGPVLYSGPTELVAFNGLLYFTAEDGTRGRELWRSDGTSAGTVLVDDVEPGRSPQVTRASSSPTQPTPFGGRLYFGATTSASGSEPWSTDGTAKARLLMDVNRGTSGYSTERVAALGSVLLFENNDGETGPELWRTDGTSAGTWLLKDIAPGPPGSAIGPIVVAGGYAYFAAFSGLSGRELWRTDGTVAGTALVSDLLPGSTTYGPNDSDPVSLTAVGSALFFQALDTTNYHSLYRVVGTAAPTRLSTMYGYPGGSTWTSDLRAVGSLLFFGAHDVTSGEELWRSDGTVSGTFRVSDAAPGADSAFPGPAAGLSGVAYFLARPFNTGLTALWRSDGTVLGTTLVTDVTPFNTSFVPAQLQSLGGRLVYRSHHSAYGQELFWSDGTASATGFLKDLSAGMNSSDPELDDGFTHNGVRYFSARDATAGLELWRTDGTAVGSFRLGDFAAGAAPSLFRPLRAASRGALVYVLLDDLQGGNPVYVTDGTAAGTRLAHRAPHLTTNSEHSWFLSSVGPRLYLAAGAADGSLQLYGFAP